MDFDNGLVGKLLVRLVARLKVGEKKEVERENDGGGEIRKKLFIVKIRSWGLT